MPIDICSSRILEGIRTANGISILCDKATDITMKKTFCVNVRNTPPCRLTTRVNPNPDWYLNLNFRDYFEINDRHYGSSNPDDYDDVANLVRFYSGIELSDDVSSRR